MFRPRSAVLAAVAMAVLLAPSAAFAAAEVPRFSLALSGIPTQVSVSDFNDGIDFYNQTIITPPPRGYDPLPKISFTWLFDGEFRYFATQNFAISAGVGQMRAKSVKEYLPALAQSINVRAELVSVPVHIGADYYLQAYNQGDFQARMFFGAGLEHYTHSRTAFEQTLFGADSATTAQMHGSFRLSNSKDAPGYYAQGGVHMFFSSRYSVLLSVIYRSGDVQGLVDEKTGLPVLDPKTGKPAGLDISGIGFRMAAVIGL